ncbi:MAG: hypothetical protein R3195_19870 [Gemmatimonadota bacterium]|nr:hypothetical protein [Gemmatimonadota bacterium]
MRARRGLAALALAAAACVGERPATTVEATAVRDSAGIRIVQNAAPRIAEPVELSPAPIVAIDGNGPPEEIPLDPTSVFELSDGTIVVGDGDQSGWDALLLYDETGRFLGKAGGEGEGPGEFGQLWFAAPYRADSIYAMDMRGSAVNIFDRRGEFGRRIAGPSYRDPIPEGSFGFVPFFADPAYEDGSFLAFPYGFLDVPPRAGVTTYVHDVLRVEPAGAVWDTLGRAPIREEYFDGERQRSLQFAAYFFQVPVGMRTVVGLGRDYEYRRMSSDWEPELIVRRAHSPVPVTRTHRQELLDWSLARFAAEDELHSLPDGYEDRFWDEMTAETLPAYSRILVDDADRVWVQDFWWVDPRGIPHTPRPSTWSVFDDAGVWLATVETPPAYVVSSISRDRIFGYRVDAVDVKHIEVYAIEDAGTLEEAGR